MSIQQTHTPAREDLIRVLTALDPRDREVVNILLLPRSPEEAAAALGVSVAEVHRRASRAVTQMCRQARNLAPVRKAPVRKLDRARGRERFRDGARAGGRAA
ncbi:sigma factor-like helix-turn-helix DNA-binding protein [Streptomyces sp. KR80]|uniref:sigma factor-like helix-turn-helix DNA-binding protein n=1 Tax=Streptomyces sp. KR80 TaxID=3457426 RepID=UPI003FD5936B